LRILKFHGPKRECSREAFHGYAIVSQPSLLFVLPGTEQVDVVLSSIAEPDLFALDGADYAGGLAHISTKHIAFFYMHRYNMNSGTNFYQRMALIPLKCHSVIQRFVCGLESRHEAVTNGSYLLAVELGDQLATLGEVRTADFLWLLGFLFSNVIGPDQAESVGLFA